MLFFFSSRRRHTRCALVTGVQTCALPISTDALLKIAIPRALVTHFDLPEHVLTDERTAAETALHETRQSLQSAQGRMSSLETLQQAALRQDDAEQIGRASCRERVCHDG